MHATPEPAQMPTILHDERAAELTAWRPPVWGGHAMIFVSPRHCIVDIGTTLLCDAFK